METGQRYSESFWISVAVTSPPWVVEGVVPEPEPVVGVVPLPVEPEPEPELVVGSVPLPLPLPLVDVGLWW